MNESKLSRRRIFALGGAAFAALFATKAKAENPHVTIDNVEATDDPDVYTFTMTGEERFFGRFAAFGELHISTKEGAVALTAAGGSQIVGVVTVAVEDGSPHGDFHLSWRDSVAIGGADYANTGRFARRRPPGLVVIAILPTLLRILWGI